ncbi:RNA polymerase III subunit C11, partial [Cryptosporidium parvum Iowa II]
IFANYFNNNFLFYWCSLFKLLAVCPKCSFSEAYFFQLQIRSADEPMTSFYTCVKCDFKWKEN